MVHRLLHTPMEMTDYIDETNTIKYIAIDNGYSSNTIDNLIQKHKQKLNNNNEKIKNNNKFISSKYTNIIPDYLSSIFKKLNITLGYKTDNNLYSFLKYKDKKPITEMTGIYKLKCNDCDKIYLGQTGRPMKDRFKEHLPTGNLNNLKSNFARHIIDHGHKYTNIDNNVDIIQNCSKGKLMNALEEFYIYRESKIDANRLLNDQLKFDSNYLYDTAIKILSNHDDKH